MFKRSQSRNFFQHRKIQNKISEKHKVITIGLVGTELGVGVTHTALLFARYFSKLRGKIAFLEWGEQGAVKMIRRTYEGEKRDSQDYNTISEPYNYKRVHYYEHGDEELLSVIRRKGYQIIIIDFGKSIQKVQESFNQMDIRFVIGRANDWKYQEIEQFYQNFTHILEQKYKDLILVLACGTMEEKRHIQQCIKGRIEILSFHKDPFQWTKTMQREIESIFEL